ncbi:hypothetical protein ACIF70_34740 [Actinacidiphila glaucinigra]|uniref:hypothetical protein n=1 Tax=Actinacidiphila glaucinigra TaxID=235986 RepID=UPI0037CAD5CF
MPADPAPIRARPAGTACLPGAGSATAGHALLRHPGGAHHALLHQEDDALALVDLDAAFAGRPAVLATVANPLPGWRNSARAASADGGLIVLSGQRSVLALEPDGRTRWEYRHGCWGDAPHRHGGPEPCPGLSRGSVQVGADGGLVWAHVLPDIDHGNPVTDSYEQWLVLDAAAGTVLGVARIEGGSQGSHQLPHPDGTRMILGTGQGQDGSPAYVGHWDGSALTVREIGDGFRIPVAVHPGGRAFLSTPHGYDSLWLHRFPDGRVLMDRDAADLAGGEDDGDGTEPAWDFVAGFVDGHTVIAAAYDAHHHREASRHWLLDALTLRPLGPVAYPDGDRYPGRGDNPVALGDGTWLTLAADGTTLNRWSPHRR